MAQGGRRGGELKECVAEGADLGRGRSDMMAIYAPETSCGTGDTLGKDGGVATLSLIHI